ncbi:MAG: hypothetical protein GF346_12035, partial [Candidatus Eisenbacteria bacterium]|nr:hypothetical protein [Candidatus Latescibacterota bacterium]MBD3303166.1 hypothetical protein [Candidatus Eisenbacteria bacterium]
ISGGIWADSDGGVGLAVGDDGRVLAAGRDAKSFKDYVARIGTSGKLDPEFGPGVGLAWGLPTPSEAGVGAIAQAGGTILFGGHDTTTDEQYLIRLDASGNRDPGFGTDGLAYTGFACDRSGGLAVATQADGKVLLAGLAQSPEEAYVVRFDAAGNLDESFGTGGVAYTGIYSAGAGVDIAVQPDGRILVATHDSSDFENVLVRFDTSGQVDTGFGSSGVARPGVLSVEGGVAVAVQEDGKILLGSTDLAVNEDYVARFDSGGALDSGFGSGGLAHTGIQNFDATDIDIIVQADGKLVLAVYHGVSQEGALWRLEPDGTVDEGFGASGFAAAGTTNGGEGLEVALQPDGRLLLAQYDGVDGDASIARFDTAGNLDTEFGGDFSVIDGLAHSGVHSPPQTRLALAVQADSRALLAGIDGNREQVFVARFQGPSGPSSVDPEVDPPVPFSLERPAPNPIREGTTIRYDLVRSTHVSLGIYDASGRLVERLVEGRMGSGRHAAKWNAIGAPAGVYVCAMEADGVRRSWKLIRLR